MKENKTHTSNVENDFFMQVIPEISKTRIRLKTWGIREVHTVCTFKYRGYTFKANQDVFDDGRVITECSTGCYVLKTFADYPAIIKNELMIKLNKWEKFKEAASSKPLLPAVTNHILPTILIRRR